MSEIEYTLVRCDRKTTAIRVLTDGSVEVRAPRRLPVQEIERFLSEKKDWIEKHRQIMRERYPLDLEPRKILYKGKWKTILPLGENKILFDGEFFYAPEHWSDAELKAAVDALNLAARSEMSSAKGKKAVKISITEVDGEDLDILDGYEIFRSTKRYKGYTTKPYFTAERTSYWNTAIKTGTRYYYKVRGVRIIDGKKYYTKWSNIITKKYTNISTSKLKIAKGVKNTKVKASSTSRKGYIKIKWKKRSDYKVDYYQIYRSTKKTSGFKYYGKTDSGSKRTYKNTKNLKKGKTYYYKVRGVRKIDGKKYYTKWSNVTWKKAK